MLHAIATFGEYSFDATSEEAASTMARFATTFCREYPLNQAVSIIFLIQLDLASRLQRQLYFIGQ